MSKHTEGPWTADETSFGYEADTTPEADANARLIAASPALLAALKAAREAMLAWIDPDWYVGSPLAAQVDAAVALAEGGGK